VLPVCTKKKCSKSLRVVDLQQRINCIGLEAFWTFECPNTETEFARTKWLLPLIELHSFEYHIIFKHMLLFSTRAIKFIPINHLLQCTAGINLERTLIVINRNRFNCIELRHKLRFSFSESKKYVFQIWSRDAESIYLTQIKAVTYLLTN
jgi:hypothetical protein